MKIFKRHSRPVHQDVPEERRSATQIYFDGGGDPEDVLAMALLEEADRPMTTSSLRAVDVQDRTPASTSPLHAYEITGADAALIRMMRGANFGPEATVVLPSGRIITGAEMQLWLDGEATA